MKQVYPRYKRSRPLPFPLEDCSFPRSGLSDLATLGQTTVRSRKRKVLSRKRKSGLDLFLSGIYLFPALQNIYSVTVYISTAAMYVPNQLENATDLWYTYVARELAWKLENFAWKWPRHALHLQRALEKIWMHEPFFIYSTILIVDVKIIQGIEILSNKCKSERADYFDTLMCFVRVSSFAFVFRFLARLALWQDCFSFLFQQFA